MDNGSVSFVSREELIDYGLVLPFYDYGFLVKYPNGDSFLHFVSEEKPMPFRNLREIGVKIPYMCHTIHCVNNHG